MHAVALYKAFELQGQSAAGRPDVPRFASICLFPATYGGGAVAALARWAFVDSACAFLVRAMLRGMDRPEIPRLLLTVRNVHHLIASCPESIPRME